MWRRYIRYIRDNPQGYWFKRKWYGWGWTPVRWQGWLTLALGLACIVWADVDFVTTAKTGVVTNATLAWFFLRLAFAIAFIIGIAYRTGEPPKWMWGIPDKKD